ncbi:MAG: hypothetical protein EKK63_14655 [Acinetobacter sp.]|uniref:hypothetical protein n=1 Tax=Acinetobacter sp. TaxID=472 RepID=UPI000FBF9052|nr:hypothetical protein [Acinetobacter sp.]RUP37506.1 MAG: hypothetical protein EKK63_14655 [Acinetobacter sp.]
MIQIKTKKYRKLALGGPWDGVKDTYTDTYADKTGLNYDEGKKGLFQNSGEPTIGSDQSFQSAGTGMGSLGNMGGSIVDAGIQLGSAAIVAQAQKKRNPNSNYTADGQNKTVQGAQGIATGWSIGNKIYPGIGGIVGAFAGGIYGAFKGNKMDKEAKLQRSLEGKEFIEKERLNMQVNNGSTSGNINSQYYAYGGPLTKSLYSNKGQINQTSSNTAEVHGPSHEEGGVPVGNNTELEGGESMTEDYVFSDRLGFASMHKKIAKAKGKIEQKAATPDRLNALKLLEKQEQQLIEAQEYIRSQYNLP